MVNSETHRRPGQWLVYSVPVAVLLLTAALRPMQRADGPDLLDLGESNLDRGMHYGLNAEGDLAGVRWIDGKLLAVRTKLSQGADDFVPGAVLHDEFLAARGMSATGVVAGALRGTSGPNRPALWDPDTDTLFALPIEHPGRAHDVNRHGTVVGVWVGQDSNHHSFCYSRHEGTQEIHSLDGHRVHGVFGIDDFGRICGKAERDGVCHAFYFSSTQGMRFVVGTDADESCAHDTNNAGQVVGVYRILGQQRAFLWDERYGMIDLDDFLPPGSNCRLICAWSIDESGRVLVYGEVPGGKTHAYHDFVLTLPKQLRPAPTDGMHTSATN